MDRRTNPGSSAGADVSGALYFLSGLGVNLGFDQQRRTKSNQISYSNNFLKRIIFAKMLPSGTND